MENTKKIVIGLLVVVLIIICCYIGYTLNTPKQTLQINDMNIEVDEWGIYNLVGHITPLKDFDYLEARMVFYDAKGTIIGTAYAWNMLHPPKGTLISVSGGLGGVCKETPAYAIVSFYDSAGSNNAIANFTVKFTDNGTSNSTSGNGDSNIAKNGLVAVKTEDGQTEYHHVGDIVDTPGGHYKVNADGSLSFYRPYTREESPLDYEDTSYDDSSYSSQSDYEVSSSSVTPN